MKNRSIFAVVLLPFATFGIYVIYWFVSTKRELNRLGADIPSAWFIIIPFVNIWWAWKYFEGAEKVTKGEVNGALMFVLDLLIWSVVSMVICQDSYNKIGQPDEPVNSKDTLPKNSEPLITNN